MEYYFFIVVIIVLKILFWTFYFYVRAQRLRQAQASQRFIIVGARPVGRQVRPCNDRSAIIHHAEPLAATSPPAYTEVVKEGQGALPPSYEQIMADSIAPPGAAVANNSEAPLPPYSATMQPDGGAAHPFQEASLRQTQTGPVP